MPLYITLLNYSDQGIRNIKDSPSRVDAAKELISSLGGEFKAFYLTMGSYDAVAIIEAPNDEVVAQIALTVGAGGNARTTTMRAFDEGQFRDIVASV